MSDYPQIPEAVSDKTYWFPESSYGAQRVTLVLVDGRRVEHVSLAGPSIVKVGPTLVESRAELDFEPGDVVDAISEV